MKQVRIPTIIHTRIIAKKKRFESLVKTLSPTKLLEIEKRMEVEFVYNSNKIEGNALTRGETRLILQGMTVGGTPLASMIPKSLDDIQAAGNHTEAMSLIRRLAFDKTYQITEADIKSIHRLIMKNIIQDAGNYRTDERIVTGAGFAPPPSYEIQNFMAILIDLINNNPDELTPIEIAAQVHYDLAWIHPFSDGNGRMARLVLNFVLLRNGYPFSVIQAVERKSYLRTLRHMDTEGDIEPFTIYVARCVEKTLDTIIGEDQNPELLSLGELAKGTPYSADYLSLLARKGRIDAIKKGKTWMTTRKIIENYVSQQQKS